MLTFDKINNHFRHIQHHFGVVIWVAVTNREAKLDEQIQVEIVKNIGLSGESWKHKSLNEKALDISNFLSKNKLLMLFLRASK